MFLVPERPRDVSPAFQRRDPRDLDALITRRHVAPVSIGEYQALR